MVMIRTMRKQEKKVMDDMDDMDDMVIEHFLGEINNFVRE